MSGNVWKALWLCLFICVGANSGAQQMHELRQGWHCKRAGEVTLTGEELSKPDAKLDNWMPAVVPGTVLANLLYNKKIPDPYFGMNNKLLPDLYDSGAAYYTYWFVADIKEKPGPTEHVILALRGVNYSFDIYANGRKLNKKREYGMFLRHRYDLTPHMDKDGKTRVAIIVYPPDHPGNPNGGQGGDGTIAKDVTNQFAAGWDWTQPIHDRNTGIWDKVFIYHARSADVQDVHVRTNVPGKRTVGGKQEPAVVTVSADVMNWTNRVLHGVLQCELDGRTTQKRISVPPMNTEGAELMPITVKEPKLWWPAGMGPQDMSSIKVRFLADAIGITDEEMVPFGIREVTTAWNEHTQSREIYVNGQRMFVKGANRIMADAMLRFDDNRYDAEVRYHRDMHLNMIRVWGGGITERPEFYDACDKYGILVMQDFWMTGDCNGRWYDTYKADDTTTRRNYPDDHKLWLASAVDQIKMLRNHPSLALWCGGNEIRPPADLLAELKTQLKVLDGTRYFFEYSNDDSMSLAAHDGPYVLQDDRYFWEHKSWGFNSEIGSVGVGDIESLERFIPSRNLVQPLYNERTGKWSVDSVWEYHKYCAYDSAVARYGQLKNVVDFTRKAQMVNYNQYRALMEGFRSHKWDWYTGVMVWKTQNPWTAMVGQMYDVYLDPNACMFGLAEGAKPLHVMYDPKWQTVMVVNDEPVEKKVKLWYSITKGHTSIQGVNDSTYVIPADTCMMIAKAPDLDRRLDGEDSTGGAFMSLRLYQAGTKNILDDNTYWFPGADSSYNWLNHLSPAALEVTATRKSVGNIEVLIKNRSDANLSFFNRISLVDRKTKKRIMPVFYSNNYISISPERYKTVTIEYNAAKAPDVEICVDEWLAGKKYYPVGN
ncbi:MAG: glycosyl hydrolase [Taibaiella sp.]|nr:glycosyl hydrolase [Taibaiella sp.]